MQNKQEPILTSIENGIQKVVFNRPAKKNAITDEMYVRLTEILNESANNEEVHVLVMTGNGDFYSSGNDFVSYLQHDNINIDIIQENLLQFINTLITYPKLLIAIVNGPAIGISATTLGLFDIVYASETAYFLTPFCKLGLSPEGCSSYIFPKIMGPSKASEMLFFGEKLSANEAAKIGFISKVYKIGTTQEIWKHIEKISSLSKESMQATKRLTSRWNKDVLMEVNQQEIKELKKMYAMPGFLKKIIEFITAKNKM